MNKLENNIKAYQYMGYLRDSIKEGKDFVGRRVNQLGARLSGKTTSDNIEMLRAILGAKRTKQSLVIFIFRMRHKDQKEAWADIVNALRKYKFPIIIFRGRGMIYIWNTKIYVKGCYTTNSTEVSLLGKSVQNAVYGIVVFEEAK